VRENMGYEYKKDHCFVNGRLKFGKPYPKDPHGIENCFLNTFLFDVEFVKR
jgi:hypothetical protein